MAERPIVTLTLNPALDISSSVEFVTPSDKLRCQSPVFEPGGGGINVSRVCQRLGESTLAVVPLGGPTGSRIADLLAAERIETTVIEIGDETRQSFSIIEDATGHQYRFVLPGPTMAADEVASALSSVVAAARGAACVVVSGSLPDGVDHDFVIDLVAAIEDTPVIVDTSGPALVAALQSGAHMVKPSARELSYVVGRTLLTEADIEDAAVEVKARSKVDVLVASIGAGGAIAIDDTGTMRLRAPTVQVRSTVGAGDSMVAGLAVGVSRRCELIDSAALGVAAGTAAVLTDGSKLCEADEVERLLPAVVRP